MYINTNSDRTTTTNLCKNSKNRDSQGSKLLPRLRESVIEARYDDPAAAPALAGLLIFACRSMASQSQMEILTVNFARAAFFLAFSSSSFFFISRCVLRNSMSALARASAAPCSESTHESGELKQSEFATANLQLSVQTRLPSAQSLLPCRASWQRLRMSPKKSWQ